MVINSERARGWVEEKVMGAARERLVGYLREADRHGRFRIYRPVTANGAPIYVHAKVLAIDDRLLRIGSANLNNRSMGFDTECDLAIEARSGAADETSVSEGITAIRNGLLSEHLATDPATIAAALSRANGSLISVVESFRRDSGRTLAPLEISEAHGKPLREGELLDPEQPEPILSMVMHAVQDRFNRR